MLFSCPFHPLVHPTVKINVGTSKSINSFDLSCHIRVIRKLIYLSVTCPRIIYMYVCVYMYMGNLMHKTRLSQSHCGAVKILLDDTVHAQTMHSR